MIGRILRWAAIIALGLQVVGCYTDYGPISTEPAPTPPPTDVSSILQAGDVVKVTVYGEDTLSGPYTINPAGNIIMPLIGAVNAAGLSRADLQQEISRKYIAGKYLQDARVTVDILSFQPIYILGEILRPGAYPYTSGLNVLTAVTLAGGFTYRASKTNVLIQHTGQTTWQEYPLNASITIAPGDLIRVPERYF